MIIIHNTKTGKNSTVAKIIQNYLKCEIKSVDENPEIFSHNTVIFVVPNTGDEELPQQMEDFIYSIKDENKNYLVCELGNYFGFENYYGCKKVIFKLLKNWKKISDISIDSTPEIDEESLKKWICQLNLTE